MSNRNEFYLTLPSNSSMGYFPDNTTATYTTRLTRNICLDGDNWEVALVEVHYPYTFHQSNEPLRVEFNFTGTSRGYKSIPIRNTQYKDIEVLLEELNGDANISNYMEFTFNDFLKRVIVKTTNVTKLVLSRSLALQLGMEPETIINDEEEELIAHWPYNLSLGLTPYMYVYCDLVEPQLIGDTSAPILKIVNMDLGKYVYGAFNSAIYTYPHYVPIMKSTFETVEINLRDDTGRKLPFSSGTSCVKLHFRRAQHYGS